MTVYTSTTVARDWRFAVPHNLLHSLQSHSNLRSYLILDTSCPPVNQLTNQTKRHCTQK